MKVKYKRKVRRLCGYHRRLILPTVISFQLTQVLEEEMTNEELEIKTNATKVDVCKYNYQGLDKKCQQCIMKHDNKTCPSHLSCQNVAIEMRHLKE